MSQASLPSSVVPGDWLGILGGGQLGRMFCHAAQSLGYKVAVLDPDEHSPAGAVADLHIQAGYQDEAALARLSERCKAITTEFENVPALSLETLADNVRVSPAGAAVAIVQDRIQEKAFIRKAGVPVAPYVAVRQSEDIVTAPDTLFPGILKVARLGYDGKGQARVSSRAEAMAAFEGFQQAECVLEAMLPLASELSVILARGYDGKVALFPSAQNEHRDGILAVSTVDDSLLDASLAGQAADAAVSIAQALEYVGVLCVEFFVLRDGSLVANEIAPRPHNSGHFTMNASASSQFEQQARAMAGLPLGNTDSLCPVVMLNLLGDLWFAENSGTAREPDWAGVLAIPGAKLHLYGKAQARPGRKMGHVNVLGATLAEARVRAQQVAQILGIEFRP
ncbi:5-(carboxyamino)imidazole ribonucleotide synthase [Pollutimonas harenae]|uniref:N5-carboxyaminoimidazole ribonucleotide synthase n=1 Tax=Pollutimonas harenae TaxID=657015 RepID=A0A853H237_9BURK|nr:5-(carboxyamino)imidazole ribonucleotide synthase [Pollutimonas harenae]NYT85305.1 5-(carboxyamino)imidazole ribonucleotide synthase [Pollutimonas harenae]TEA70411.1 5-(carboxyamino)imidazole ribonucleotide synthase [Pollutimonas harenae]